MSDADIYLASLLDDAIAKVPQARGLRDFLCGAGVSLGDAIDHVALPLAGDAPAGWVHVAPGIWRNLDGLPPLRDDRTVRIVLRVADVEALRVALRLDAQVEGAAGGPYRRAELFAAGGVSFAAVERCGWTGFDLPEVNARQIRRAQIHYQILATRRRSFRDPEQGYAHLARLLAAAVADLGPHWASGLFVRSELAYWRAHCDAAQAVAVRQARAGLGFSNVTSITFAAAREHFHRAAEIARMLGYRSDAWLQDGTGGFGAQGFACPLLARPSLLLECDGVDAPEAPGVAATWFGPPGLWCALHGEGMLEGGARAITLRGVAAAGAARRPVNPVRVDALERERYLSRPAAEDIRAGGAEGAVLSGAVATLAPYGQLQGFANAATAPPPPRQRHRIKRQR